MSISGLSGILAGVYALIGAGIGYHQVYGFNSRLAYGDHDVNESAVLMKLSLIALLVLAASLSTAVWLAVRKARRQGQSVWNEGSRALLKAVVVPLVAGGLFIFIQLVQGNYGVLASACLLFYGLALMTGSRYTYHDVQWLGVLQVVLGLTAAALPGYGLLFWSIGFGVLHILYGLVMYLKYDRREAA